MTRNKIRVLHIITRLDPGGSSTNTIETAARLDPHRYSCTLISGKTHDPDGLIARQLHESKIDYRCIEDLRRSVNPYYDLKAFFKLYAVLKKERFDIVHTHTSKAGILGRWAARLAGVPAIIHTPHGHVFYGYFNRWLSKFFLWIERATAPITDRIITLTELGKREHVDFRIARPEKFTVIPSGIDAAFFCLPPQSAWLRNELGIPKENFIFGSVARLDPIKGHRYLIEAFAEVLKKFPRTFLVLVGEGSERKALEELAQKLRVWDSVCFAGFQKDVTSCLHFMDCFVLASINEGMGRSILEAMACGKPVIATRTGGIPELITHGQEGYLVPPQSIPGLAEAMLDLVKNPERGKEFGRRGQLKADQRFSLQTMVRSIDELYQSVIQKSAA